MHDQQFQVLRILDANLNRSMEALRSVEEYVRFMMDDTLLTTATKSLRHRIQQLAEQIPLEERMMARDVTGDVGGDVSIQSEYSRHTARDVLQAGLERLKQSLRVLEEYSKLIEVAVAVEFEKIRYEVYTLEKRLVIQDSSCQRLKLASIYALVDGADDEATFESHIRSLLAAGVDAIQLRDKQLNDQQLLGRAKQLRRLIDEFVIDSETEVLLIINDRPDLARLSHADGVHIGQSELSVRDARMILGTQCIVGVSTHSPEQVERAVSEGADYIGCGPTFPSTTKAFEEYPGLEFLDWVSKHCGIPAFAIGGISESNVAQVAEAGVGRVAVSGCLRVNQDHAAVIRALRETLAVSDSQQGTC